MDFTIVLIIGGAVLGAALYHLIQHRRQQKIIRENSVVLMHRVRQVLKVITVEGDFSEIVTYNNVKPTLLNLYQAEKKTIVTVSAKAMVGFDLAKIQINKDDRKRTITLNLLPEPEIVSIDLDIEYYDIRNNLLNKFTPDDYTRINQLAKENIRKKIPESGLYEKASEQAIALLNGLEQVAEKLKWKLDYSNLLSFKESKSAESEIPDKHLSNRKENI